jgi:hypothetical protein
MLKLFLESNKSCLDGSRWLDNKFLITIFFLLESSNLDGSH